jgi:hypothetical protein
VDPVDAADPVEVVAPDPVDAEVPVDPEVPAVEVPVEVFLLRAGIPVPVTRAIRASAA